MELYRPIGSTPLFVAPYAGVGTRDLQPHRRRRGDRAVPADRRRVGLNVGVNLGAQSDVRVGAYVGRSDGVDQGGRSRAFRSCAARRPGAETRLAVDTQDSPVVPARRHACPRCGCRASSTVPTSPSTARRSAFDASLTQLSGDGAIGSGASARAIACSSTAASARRSTTIRCRPISSRSARRSGSAPTDAGEMRGRHYYVATGGYLRQVGRLPDFMGGPVFAGGWLENGDAFDEWSRATLADQRRRRRRDGHARRAGHARRLVGLRRTLAHLPRRRADLPLRRRHFNIPPGQVTPTTCRGESERHTERYDSGPPTLTSP